MDDATSFFPLVDATQQDVITDDQAQFFRENGLLVVRNVLRGDELRAMQEQTMLLVNRAIHERPKDPDFMYRRHEITKQEVPFRVEYVIDKTRAGKALLGHPFILRSIEKLQGRNFVPTWDSMVFKTAGAGVAIPWHRDAAPYAQPDVDNDVVAINVDFYLDGSDITNCLWGILGSNRWSTDKAGKTIKRLNADGFGRADGAVPILMHPGDVIFHSILVLHGSPASQSQLRRVVYYEFRPGEVEREHGPHVPDYIALKHRVLLSCLRERATAPYARGETIFTFSPSPAFAPTPLTDREQLPAHRYHHPEYWRK